MDVVSLLAHRLEAKALAPDRVVDSVDGDLSFYFWGRETLDDGSHRRLGSISLVDGADLVAYVESRGDGPPVVWDVDPDAAGIDAAIEKLRAFLGA